MHFYYSKLSKPFNVKISVKLPVAKVTGPIFVCRAACAATNAVDILIAFGGVLGKVDPGTEHPSYVSVALIEAFVDDGVDEWGT